MHFLRLLFPSWMLFGLAFSGGGIGNSKSSSTTNSTQIDKRMTAGDSSVQVSGDSNNVTITDAGSTKAALSLAAFTTYLGVTSAQEHEASTRAVFGQALSGVDKAYEISRAGDQREVSMVVAVAIALAAAVTLSAVFGKKG